MAQESLLTFEQFTKVDGGVPYYDNFPIHFWRGYLADYYRTLLHYSEFKKEAPDLEKRLRESISPLPKLNAVILDPFNRDLYEAYIRMRKYVSSDADLALPPR